jgi:hypothetical protein
MAAANACSWSSGVGTSGGGTDGEDSSRLAVLKKHGEELHKQPADTGNNTQ